MLESGSFPGSAGTAPAVHYTMPAVNVRRTRSTRHAAEPLPPQAECRLIGMLLNGLWHDNVGALDSSHFAADWLGGALRSITALREQGKPAVDLILDDTMPAGELAGLRQLADREYSKDEVLLAHCARRIQQDGLTRQFQAAAAAGNLDRSRTLLDRIQKLDQANPDGTGLTSQNLSDVQARPIEWLWRPFIARRSITMIAGDSDVGKSKATAAIVAAITTGAAFPMTDQAPSRAGRVIILSAEEDAATVLKPALLAAGADPSKVIVAQSAAEYDRRGRLRNRAITLQRDIAGLRALLEQMPDVDAIDIDPITAYLGDKDSNSSTAVRAVIADLQRLAEDFNLAIILQTHFGKDAERNAKARVLGSIAFVAGPRQVISVIRDPQDATRARRYFIPMKCNNIPEAERTGLAFVINGIDVIDGAVAIPNIGRVEWLPERVTLTADDVLRMARRQEQEERDHSGHSGPSLARQAVIKALREAGTPLTSRRIAEAVYGEEIPDHTDARRAAVRKLLGKMLRDRQIKQLADRTYTLPSGESDHRDHRNQGDSKEAVTAVTAVTGDRQTASVITAHSGGHSSDHRADLKIDTPSRLAAAGSKGPAAGGVSSSAPPLPPVDPPTAATWQPYGWQDQYPYRGGGR